MKTLTAAILGVGLLFSAPAHAGFWDTVAGWFSSGPRSTPSSQRAIVHAYTPDQLRQADANGDGQVIDFELENYQRQQKGLPPTSRAAFHERKTGTKW